MPLSRFFRASNCASLSLLILLATVLSVPPASADELTRQVQEELRKRKLYFGDVDGRLSEQVAAALRRYQQRKGFAATGETDPTTLRSLSLIFPTQTGQGSVSAEGDGTSTPPPPLPGPTPWPDIPVLRSDQARIGPPGSDPANAADRAKSPTPTPAPPPSAAALRRPDAVELRSFIENYLRAGANNDLPAEMNFYADHVDYFEDGPVNHRYIAADVARYDHRWPERHFTLLEGLTFDAPDPVRPNQIIVHCRVHFATKRPGYNVQGDTDNVYTLTGSGPQDWRISGMKEQRVRAK